MQKKIKNETFLVFNFFPLFFITKCRCSYSTINNNVGCEYRENVYNINNEHIIFRSCKQKYTSAAALLYIELYLPTLQDPSPSSFGVTTSTVTALSVL